MSVVHVLPVNHTDTEHRCFDIESPSRVRVNMVNSLENSVIVILSTGPLMNKVGPFHDAVCCCQISRCAGPAVNVRRRSARG